MPETLELLRRRSSVRDYAPDPIPEADWETMLRLGQQAATDATGQLYSAVEVREPERRRRIAHLAGDQEHVRTAPRFLVVCLDVRRLRLLLEHRGERLGIRPFVSLLFGITDAALFAQQLSVAAAALGYGTCFIGGVQNHARAIAGELALPTGVVPLWGLTVGRPRARPPPKPRVPLGHVHHIDAYRDPTSAELAAAYETMKAATRSGDWLHPLRKYFATGGIMEAREPEFRGLLGDQGFGGDEAAGTQP